MGHEVTMVPLYLPLTLDETDQSAETPIFFSGINVYLEQKSASGDNYSWNRMLQTPNGNYTGVQEGNYNNAYFDTNATKNTVTIGQKGSDNTFNSMILGSPYGQQSVYVEQHSWDQTGSWEQPTK